MPDQRLDGLGVAGRSRIDGRSAPGHDPVGELDVVIVPCW